MARCFEGLALVLLLPGAPAGVAGLRPADPVRGELVWREWAGRDYQDSDHDSEFEEADPSSGTEAYNETDCEMMKNLWQSAHRSLTSVRQPSALCSQIKEFNQPSCREHITSKGPCTTVAIINGVTLYYDRIWKNANNAMKCNLRVINETDTASCNKNWSPNVTTVRFTLIRDPLSRFVSGYSEIEFYLEALRNESRSDVGDPYVASPFEQYSLGSRERASQFIQDVLMGNTHHAVFHHVHPQVGTIQRSGALVAGKLEEFDYAWARVEKRTGCRMPFNFGCGTHPETNSNSKNPWRTAMAALVQEPGVAESLKCSILLPDYACFDNVDLHVQMPHCVPQFVATEEEYATVIERMKQLHCPDGIKLLA